MQSENRRGRNIGMKVVVVGTGTIGSAVGKILKEYGTRSFP
jgi:phosphoglycerate dehydrogenase-like enzyme